VKSFHGKKTDSFLFSLIL